jgi:hypothetical protein
LNSRRPAPQRSTSAALHASPAVISVFTDASASAASADAISTTGGIVACVIACCCVKLASALPVTCSEDAGMCRLAPCAIDIASSHANASKLSDENCSTRLDASTCSAWRCQVARLHQPRCSTITPFGRPVDPEV